MAKRRPLAFARGVCALVALGLKHEKTLAAYADARPDILERVLVDAKRLFGLAREPKSYPASLARTNAGELGKEFNKFTKWFRNHCIMEEVRLVKRQLQSFPLAQVV